MNPRAEALLWGAQRASAGILALCVAVHLATIVYAVQGGLTAGEILSRTRGSAGWFAFYGLFVLAASVHAPIGLRTVAIEWLGWRGRSRDAAALLVGIAILWAGMHAVVSVFA